MHRTAVFRRLLGECLQFRRRIALLLGGLVALAAARLYLTWLVKIWSDRLIGVGDRGELTGLMTAAVAVMAAIVALVFVTQYLMAAVNHGLVERMRNRAEQRLLHWELGALRGRHSGDLLSRVLGDAAALSGFARDVFRRVLGEGIVLAGAVGMMFYLDWRLAAGTLLVVPLVALLLAPLGARIRRVATVAQERLAGLTELLEEQLRGASTVKGFRAEAFEGERFRAANAVHRGQMMHAEVWSSLLLTMVWLVTGAGLLAVFWYGTGAVVGGRLTPGGLLAFCLYAGQTVEPLRHLSEVHAIVQRGLASAERLYELIDFPRLERDPSRDGPAPRRGAVCLENVHFRYAADQPVLRGLDLNIEAGEAVAVVSASGGGKSTIAGLLARFFSPQAGRVTLDGEDLEALPLDTLRRAVCVVEQEPFLFSGPLIDNLRYGTAGAPPERIREAVRRAGLDSLAAELPGGLEQRLAQAGRDLSGGQRQRIALARAIVRDPLVLVLDEATSALDGDTEAQIFAALDAWLARRTVIVMAHRLSTVVRFPRIVVVDAGRVAGDGDLAALVRDCAPFRRLFADQLAALPAWEPAGSALSPEPPPAARFGR